jgi:hypothetical protein
MLGRQNGPAFFLEEVLLAMKFIKMIICGYYIREVLWHFRRVIRV